MIDRDIDPVSGYPNRYDEDGYPRTCVLMPPAAHWHSYEAGLPGWLPCRNAHPDGKPRRSGEAWCDAPRIPDAGA